MTKAEAFYDFWSDFGVPAFEENSLYELDEEPELPYLTYEVATDAFSDEDIPLSATLWARSGTWEELDALSERISAAFGRIGKLLVCDTGKILLIKRRPFAQHYGDDADNLTKRVLISISVRFYTNI